MEDGEKPPLEGLTFEALKSEMAVFFDIPLERVEHFFEMMDRTKGPLGGPNVKKNINFTAKWKMRELNSDALDIETTERKNATGDLMENLKYRVGINRTGTRWDTATGQMIPFPTLLLYRGAARL